ncbi:Ribosomal protein L14b/L23e [Macleaya cordata]|uniref:Ribosomal protein L14b/L23e n=1 Tax=Macleaya cordata TaxID=56857 RepID=A0A200Q7V7_MACCD|nr:Ribosomal protein L14b/L23e [Macleaya cordata]
MRTNLKVVDNSGAKRVMCIQALKRKKGARLGDTIIASVKEAQPRGKFKKDVYGVVVRAAMQRVLVNKQGEPIGTCVFGPVPHELRRKRHIPLYCVAEEKTGVCVEYDSLISRSFDVFVLDYCTPDLLQRVFAPNPGFYHKHNLASTPSFAQRGASGN